MFYVRINVYIYIRCTRTDCRIYSYANKRAFHRAVFAILVFNRALCDVLWHLLMVLKSRKLSDRTHYDFFFLLHIKLFWYVDFFLLSRTIFYVAVRLAFCCFISSFINVIINIMINKLTCSLRDYLIK